MQQRASEGTMTDELYERYAATILRYLRQHTTTREDAEDILVDVFVAALEDVKFAQLCEHEQRAWLWRVARNKLVDAFRHSSGRRNVPLEQIFETVEAQDTQNPEWLALHLDDVIRTQRILEGLSPLQQEVMLLRFRYDLRCAEIASILGKREQAIRTMLSRTLNLLRNRHAQR